MRGFSLSVKFGRRLNAFSFTHWMSMALVLFAMTACTNIGGKFGAGPSSILLLSNPNDSSSAGSFHLNQVNPDPNFPTTMYAMVGQDSEFDTYCAGSLGTCSCEFTFTQPGVGAQTVDVTNSYQESNLLRCPTSAVPSGITTFNVRIVVVPTGASPTPTSTTYTYYSNTITVNLATSGAFAGSTTYIDLTNAASYVPVQRFQCRKRDFIKNPTDNSIIDPLQSQNPAVIYPFNLYTTNVGDSLLSIQQQANQSWDCSLLGGVLPSTLGGSVNPVQWWANPNVFSVTTCGTSFCSGDGQLMYPQNSLASGKIPQSNPNANGKRRSSFALSPQAYGVFQVPLVAAVSPIDYVHSTYSTIGYAAKPVPNVSGTSSCPNITLPPKSTWVKIWNFRATNITSPQVVTGSQSVTNSTIACDSAGVFPSCDTVVPNGGNPNGFGADLLTGTWTNTYDSVHNTSSAIASRVALLSSTAGSSVASACYNVNTSSWNANPSPFHTTNPTTETWYASPYRFPGNLAPQVTLGVMEEFPWNIYAQASSSLIACNCLTNDLSCWLNDAACGGTLYTVPAEAPQDTQAALTTTSLEPNNNPYSDQLFVVTDPAVVDTDMISGAGSVSQYTPRTYRAASDCPGPTINGTCTAAPILWLNNVKAVNDPTSAQSDVFPLCAIQFYD